MFFPESGRAHAILPAKALREVERIVETASGGGLLNAFIGGEQQMAGIFQTFGQEEVCRSVLKVFPPVAVEGTHTYGIFFADIFEGDVFGKVNVHIGDDLIYLGIFFRGEVDRFLGEHDFADEVYKEQIHPVSGTGDKYDLHRLFDLAQKRFDPGGEVEDAGSGVEQIEDCGEIFRSESEEQFVAFTGS